MKSIRPRHAMKLNHTFEELAARQSMTNYDMIRHVANIHKLTEIYDFGQCILYRTRTGLGVIGWYDSPAGANGFDILTDPFDCIVRLTIGGQDRGYYARDDHGSLYSEYSIGDIGPGRLDSDFWYANDRFNGDYDDSDNPMITITPL